MLDRRLRSVHVLVAVAMLGIVLVGCPSGNGSGNEGGGEEGIGEGEGGGTEGVGEGGGTGDVEGEGSGETGLYNTVYLWNADGEGEIPLKRAVIGNWEIITVSIDLNGAANGDPISLLDDPMEPGESDSFCCYADGIYDVRVTMRSSEGVEDEAVTTYHEFSGSTSYESHGLRTYYFVAYTEDNIARISEMGKAERRHDVFPLQDIHTQELLRYGSRNRF